MPVINRLTGDVCYGRVLVSVNGAVPAALAGIVADTPVWLNSTDLVYQNQSAGDRLYRYNTSTAVNTQEDPTGLNFVSADSDVWVKQVNGVVTSSTAIDFGTNRRIPEKGAVDEDGRIVFFLDGQTANGLRVVTSAGGTVMTIGGIMTSTTVYLRGDVVTYQQSDGWHVATVPTGRNVPGFVSRENVLNLIPVPISGRMWLYEYEHTNFVYSLRDVGSGRGFVVNTDQDPFGDLFNLDARALNDTTIRLAWCSIIGEDANTLQMLDVNITTGATVHWTVVGGVLVSATGPTLEQQNFALGNTGAFPPPVTNALTDGSVMTDVWQSWVRNLNQSVQTIQTAANLTPTVPAVLPTPSVMGPPSSTDNALARWDGITGKLLQNGVITEADDGTLSLPDNIRQTFNPGADAAGLNVGAAASEPGTPVDGDVFYDSGTNSLKARINGAWVELGAGLDPNLDFLTWSDESADLPDSRNVLAGDAIAFDDGTANQRTVDVQVDGVTVTINGSNQLEASVAALDETFLTATDESGTLTNSRQLIAGTNVTFDDSVANQRTVNVTPAEDQGYWSPLTNGMAATPELVFADGDAVMCWVPL